MSEKLSTAVTQDESVTDTSEFDNVLYFIKENEQIIDPDSTIDGAKIVRKLDLIILPLLCCIYFLQFLDKSLLNYAAAMGIKKSWITMVLAIINLLICPQCFMHHIYLENL